MCHAARARRRGCRTLARGQIDTWVGGRHSFATRALAPRASRWSREASHPSALYVRSAALLCGGRSWVVFPAWGKAAGTVEVRAVAVAGAGAIEQPRVLLTVAVPELAPDSALFPAEMRLTVGCHEGRSAVLGLVRTSKELSALSTHFTTWDATPPQGFCARRGGDPSATAMQVRFVTWRRNGGALTASVARCRGSHSIAIVRRRM